MVVRKVIEIDEDLCTGCGQCVAACAEGALEIVNGKARVVSDRFCDGLGACIGECPDDALRIVEREVEEFDELAVKKHLSNKRDQEQVADLKRCPSTKVELLDEGHGLRDAEGRESLLGHWPIKIMLVPESASFLKDKELVLMADCAAVAYARLHEDFLDRKAIVIGCPKFDETRTYVDRLTRIVKSGAITALTIVHMEVPCCFSLQRIAEEAVRASGRVVPLNEVVITRKGEAIRSRIDGPRSRRATNKNPEGMG
ncbi:MAG: 4Fe-4S binding protein [Deltaproteobacteria bacterium]|nr:4Fe-4S binding protein [Deltaproteobacteria bacterium]